MARKATRRPDRHRQMIGRAKGTARPRANVVAVFVAPLIRRSVARQKTRRDKFRNGGRVFRLTRRIVACRLCVTTWLAFCLRHFRGSISFHIPEFRKKRSPKSTTTSWFFREEYREDEKETAP